MNPSHPRNRAHPIRTHRAGPWLLALVFAGLPACKQNQADQADDAEAVATVRNADGTQVGRATFTSVSGGVKLHFEGEQLPPGPRGFHVHEHGVCEGPSFESAGAHFNPTGHRHGLDDPAGAHVGDLPNLVVGADGRVTADFVLDGATLTADGDTSLLAGNGTALVIHADEDDQTTDPAGAAGSRMACGVIERRTP